MFGFRTLPAGFQNPQDRSETILGCTNHAFWRLNPADNPRFIIVLSAILNKTKRRFSDVSAVRQSGSDGS
jgi:hypothetical protein